MSILFYIQVVIAIVLVLFVTWGILNEDLMIKWEDKQIAKIKRVFGGNKK